MIEKELTIETGFNFNNSYSTLPQIFFTKQNPTHVPEPRLVAINYSLIAELGLNTKMFQSDDGIEILAGNKIPKGAIPIAEAYGGHQFGHFTMLGDGRAILIGEHITPSGDCFDFQLKGSGRTPYSRGGDGKAALGPMLREYIISEAMNSLGIPTTRSLAVVTTGESISREEYLPGAILTRIASSHIRVGTFQFAANWGTDRDLKELADYTIKRHFPNIENEKNKYLSLLEEVVKKQASLIAKWQLVGFIHGVMNTDNITISGETIDYGPCAFMDIYNPETVFSSIDRHGRYAYGNQPKITGWNLARFAETLIPLLHNNQEEVVEIAQNAVSKFADLYKENWISGMRAKLGLFNEELQDQSLIEDLLNMMHRHGADYTNTFCGLTLDKIDNIELFNTIEFNNWYKLWQERLGRQSESKELVKELMENSNPAVIPRNHRVEEALEAAVKNGDYSVMDDLLKILSKPYDYSKDYTYYSTLPKKSNTPYKTFCGT
ncbi:protein adenylyltransferase SelO [Clostridium sp.]|uniref:protein adenylyltransferase SelO n=1 Tax=Clostridium sp. TaxID=1506 RepID=UPI002631D57B|nr:YdiU family protein [Clostridium sp.]